MKRFLLAFVFLTMLSGFVMAQTLTDQQAIETAIQLKKQGMAEADIAANLMQKGATMEQIQRIRNQYSGEISKVGMDATVDGAIADASDRMRTDATPTVNVVSTSVAPTSSVEIPEVLSPAGQKVFGRDIFNNPRLTFEPQMNLATPQNYVLGPGDVLVVDIYGQSQQALKLTVSPDGNVTIPEFGPVHVSGLTVTAAQNKIRGRIGGYYQGSQIKASLGQTRSILVNVMGEVQAPGNYTISAFSTVLHALYVAGGVNELGTLRAIKVFRQGKLITVVDVYEFILNGRLAGNVRLEENDVIQVGPYDCIVDISGPVKRPMAYELKKGETLATLINYAGGFAANAYKENLRVQRNSGLLKKIFNVDEKDWAGFKLDDGDNVTVDVTYDRYENMVEIKGAVFRPGMYQLGEKVNSVKSLIERAAGLREEAMTSRAVLSRMKPNRTQEVIPLDIEGILSGKKADIQLKNEDVILIPTIAEHTNARTVTITGEVIAPGTFEYADNMTLEDLILKAGGLTDMASTAKIEVSRSLRDPGATSAGMDIAKTFTFALKDNYIVDGQKGFVLEPYDIVNVRRSPLFQDPIQVSIDGEVTFRGSYTMEKKNQRLSDLVKEAGGVLPGAYIRGARLIRQMTADEKARVQKVLEVARQSVDGADSVSIEKLALQDSYTVGIHLDEALENPGSTQDIELINGDLLVIPRYNHTVRISGDVNAPNTVAFESGKGYKYYVEQAGGFGNRAKRSHTYIVYQNGTIAKASKGKIEPGCEVIVPSREKRDSNAAAQWVTGIATGVSSLATMAAAVAYILR